jgi:stage V sporulation protein D (sporulation-specific penicillin-binding protein)
MGDAQERQRVNGRFMLLRFVIVAAGLVLAARVVHVQIVLHEKYRARAEDQWGKEIAINAERGDLFDRHGRPLALSVTTWQIGVTKGNVDDLDALCDVLAEILEQPAAQIRRKITGKGSPHAVLARDMVLTATQLRRLQRDGQQAVTTDAHHSRIYPTDGVGAALIGFFRSDPAGDITTGFENSLNCYLAGRPGRAREIRTGLTSTKLGQVVLQEAEHGQSLVLTVDADLQTICEDRLAEAVRRVEAQSGSVLVMDPANGDILAAASWPLMETRAVGHADPRIWQNRNFTAIYEPGSVFKVFTTASLLRNSAIDTQTVFNCNNQSGEKIYVRNDDGHDYGDLSLMRAFAKSSNVYFAKASANLRPQELYRDLTNFGFGQETSLRYPGQTAGILKPPVDWSGRSLQTIAIGQEVAVTSLQLGMALCSVANGGTLYAPRFIREIHHDRGRVIAEVPPVAMRRVMASPLSALLREAMARVVRDGTGKGTRLDWVDAGGKTGTAQLSLDGKTYTRGAYVASFGGIVPVDQPRLVILTVLDQPRSRHHYAADSAVPLFKSIVCDIRRSTDWLTDVPGSRTAPFAGADASRLVAVPDVMYLAVNHAAQRLSAQGLEVSGAEKAGCVVQQIPAPGTRCAPGTEVVLTVAEELDSAPAASPGLCPDFAGLSNRQVRSLAARLRVPVAVQGVGYAVGQNVAPGRRWGPDGVTVVMRDGRL